MLSLVKLTLIGTVAETPIIRDLDDGRKVVGLSLFTLRQWGGGEGKAPTEKKEWHRALVVHQGLAGYAADRLQIDDDVYLEGDVRTRYWQDDTYEWRSSTEILLWREGDQLRRIPRDAASCDEVDIDAGLLAVAGGTFPDRAPSGRAA